MIKPSIFSFYAFLFFLFIGSKLLSQDLIEPAKIYKSGDAFLATNYGIEMSIPNHWIGYLPQDNEIFMMNCDSAKDANAMYFASTSNLKNIKSNWKKGFPLAPGLNIMTKGKILEQDGILSAELEVTSSNASRGYVQAKCGDFGHCITVMMHTPSQFYPPFEGKLRPLIDNTTFVKPVPRSQLEKFNWQKELTGKLIFSSESDRSSKKESKVWLNFDGTFKSKMTRTGLFKGTAGKYKGSKKGTYLIYNEEKGKPARLVLFFNNLPEVALPLEVKDKQNIINGQVFYISYLK